MTWFVKKVRRLRNYNKSPRSGLEFESFTIFDRVWVIQVAKRLLVQKVTCKMDVEGCLTISLLRAQTDKFISKFSVGKVCQTDGKWTFLCQVSFNAEWAWTEFRVLRTTWLKLDQNFRLFFQLCHVTEKLSFKCLSVSSNCNWY